jgi:molecular chaperone GrpE
MAEEPRYDDRPGGVPHAETPTEIAPDDPGSPPRPGREPDEATLTVLDEDEAVLIPAAEPEAPPPAVDLTPVLDALSTVTDAGSRIEQRLDELQTLFHREIRAEATREKVVDRLHAELQEYKQGLLLNTLRPVFVDLIQLHDDIGKVAVLPPDAEEGPALDVARRFVALLEGFQQGIEDILYRQGVEPFQVEGDAFDPRQQRAVGTSPTDDPALNKTIAARHRKGFRADDRVIRPELVSVYATKKQG